MRMSTIKMSTIKMLTIEMRMGVHLSEGAFLEDIQMRGYASSNNVYPPWTPPSICPEGFFSSCQRIQSFPATGPSWWLKMTTAQL